MMLKNSESPVRIRSARLDHAIQEAAQKGWRIHFRFTTDPRGRLTRFGYYFEEESTKDKPPPVTWLQPDEFTVEGKPLLGSVARLGLSIVDKDGRPIKTDFRVDRHTISKEPPKN